MPPCRAGDRHDLAFEHHARCIQHLHRVANPGDIGAAQMSPIVEGEFAHSASDQRFDGGEEFARDW